jgi:hypothetical protein
MTTQTQEIITPGQDDALTITQRLAQPFDPQDVKFLPKVVQGNRALAMAYADARTVMDRLDDVLGVEGWQDSYEVLPDGSVVCRLKVLIDGQWLQKMDVGSPSEQPDGGDRMKAAFSDSLKRAAVKFGIGRYLYRLPANWCDFDPARKQFIRTPALPAFALPRHHRSQPQAARDIAAPAKARLPEDGRELLDRIKNYEVKLVAEGLCSSGDLLAVLARAGARAGLGSDIASWGEPGINLAAKETKAFETRARRTASAVPAADGPEAAPAGQRQAYTSPAARLSMEDRLRQLHRLVKSGGTSKTWGKALNWFSKEHKEWGIRIPEQFEEPATEDAAAEMAAWITEAAVDGMLEAYATAARVGKAAAEVRRNT